MSGWVEQQPAMTLRMGPFWRVFSRELESMSTNMFVDSLLYEQRSSPHDMLSHVR